MAVQDPRQISIDKGLGKNYAGNQTRSGEKENQPIDNKTQTPKKSKTLRYPYAMLDNNTDYLKIDIATYEPPKLNLKGLDLTETNVGDGKGGDKYEKRFNETTSSETFKSLQLQTGTRSNAEGLKNPKGTILLPIPKQLSDTTSISWGDGGLNPIEAFGVAATGALMENANPLEIANAALEFLKSKGASAISDTGVRNAITAALSGAAVGALGGNVSANQLVSRATGQVLNPNLELLFDGVSLRAFPFTFEFFPRNAREAQEVMKIIRTLKQSMSARGNSKNDATSGVFISAPDVFQVTYMKGRKPHPFLNKFKPMALTAINLNYTGSNSYTTFPDGTPTHIIMELSFKELNPIYSEDYDEGIGKIGVGY